jgi:CheY-like chemotaxis protein
VQLNQRGQAIKILLVLDEQIFASFVGGLLKDLGFDVAGIVSTRSEAASIALDQPPDLALIDLKRGGPRSGFDIARMLDQDFGVPSVFLTDSAGDNLVEGAHRGAISSGSVWPSQALNAIEEALKRLPA